MLTLAENLKSRFKITTVNLMTISEDFQKKFLNDFLQKKTEELKIILDNELWKITPVSFYF